MWKQGAIWAVMAGFLLPAPAIALELSLPFTSELTTQVVTAPDSHAIATGPFANGTLPLRVLEGRVERQVFRLPGQSLTTLQLLIPLRDQLAAADYEIILECDAPRCGGFDFRFGVEVLPAPDMYVDLTDFRYIAARNGTDDHIALLVSASTAAGFVQMIRVTSDPEAGALRVGSPGAPAPVPTRGESVTERLLSEPQPATRPSGPVTLADSLRQRGYVILSDLTFDTGSSDLADQRFATLQSLADFLLEDPARRIALVGHTDAVGGLAVNQTLSRARANSVLQRLTSDYGVPAAQLEAEGIAYLSPLAPNSDSAGREINRRVEAVLLNTQ